MEITQSKEDIIANFQLHLKLIRQAINCDQGELGELIGVSRQTINNIENFRSPLNATQYVALAAVIDKKIEEKPALRNLIDAILIMEVDEEIANLWLNLYEKSTATLTQQLWGGSTGAKALGFIPLGIGGLLGGWLTSKAVDKFKKK